MDLNSQNLNDLFVAYKTAFQAGFSSLGAEGEIWQQYAMMMPSTAASEVYPFLKTLPKLREWLGDRVVHSMEAAKFSIRNRKFELTEGVARDSIDDDSWGLYGPTFQEFGRSSSEHPNELCVEVLESNPICYDGQPLFDVDHPVLDANGEPQSVSNDMGGAGPAWYVMDLSRAIKPMIFQQRRDYAFRSLNDLNSERVFMTDQFLFGVDARVNAGPGLWQLVVRSKQDFTAANYAAARERLKTLKGDYGRPLGLRHTHTMIPGSLEQEARKVIVSGLTTGGETNEWAGSSQIIENPWLVTA